MADDRDRLIADAKLLGFEYHGQAIHGGHLQFVHTASGRRLTASSTPSDWHSWENSRRDMEKLSGLRLPRDNKAHYKRTRVQVSNMNKTAVEIEAGEEADRLVTKANQLRVEFNKLIEIPDRRNAQEARKVLNRFEEIREDLKEYHRVLDPLF